MATLSAQERGLQAQKHLQKTANIAIWREKTCIFLWRSAPSRLLLNIRVAFHEILMYQIVTIRLLDFYLVEDVDSRDAENEGLSLVLQFKWLPQGIFWLVDGVKTPPQSCAFTSDCLCFSLGV